MTYNAVSDPLATPCVYPACTAGPIADVDNFETNTLLRRELPEGGMRMVCKNLDCGTLEGDLWVMWQEPSTFAAIGAADSDQCPDPASDPSFGAFSIQPRCIHIRFKL